MRKKKIIQNALKNGGKLTKELTIKSGKCLNSSWTVRGHDYIVTKNELYKLMDKH